MGDRRLSHIRRHPEGRKAVSYTHLREQTERLTQMTKTLLEMSNLQQVARNEQLQLCLLYTSRCV